MLPRDSREIVDRLAQADEKVTEGRISFSVHVEIVDLWYAERAYAEEAAEIDRIEFAKLRVD